MSGPAVCVFCGSSPGADHRFAALARQTAAAIVDRGLTLVYGGAQVGLMGTLADAVLARGGSVIGVLPQILSRVEIAHPGLTELHITDGMLERKQLMAERSDAFMALPGGLGTLDELFEMLTWTQLGLQDKPVGLIELDGFWAGLHQFLDNSVSAGFVHPDARALLDRDDDPARLLDRLLPEGRPGR